MNFDNKKFRAFLFVGGFRAKTVKFLFPRLNIHKKKKGKKTHTHTHPQTHKFSGGGVALVRCKSRGKDEI